MKPNQSINQSQCLLILHLLNEFLAHNLLILVMIQKWN